MNFLYYPFPMPLHDINNMENGTGYEHQEKINSG